MSVVKVQGNASGTGIFTVAAPATNTDRTLTLPDQTGTILSNAGPFTASSSATAGAVTIDASSNVGIGTSSPGQRLQISNTSSSGFAAIRMAADSRSYDVGVGGSASGFQQNNWYVYDVTGAATRMVIDSSGSLLVGTTTVGSSSKQTVDCTSTNGIAIVDTGNAGGRTYLTFTSNGATTGSVSRVGTTNAVTYATSSDYRLKHDIAPMTGALAKVAALNPVTYKWNADNSDGEGFIAHELAEVVPDAVVGTKDAMDSEGNPVYQGIDTSFLVATLTAAIQEQQAIIESLTARITALEAA